MENFKRLEKKFRQQLNPGDLACIRLDGKSFHTFTKVFNRPFDVNFMKAMNDAAESILTNILTEASFAYVQSDEISIFFTNTGKRRSSLTFAGKVEKILSTSASAATGGFMKSFPTEAIPIFDSRMMVFEDFDQVHEYLDWRRLDARKNAISMAASTLFSDKQLKGRSTKERWEMLQETEFAVLPDSFMWGRLIVKERFTETVTFMNNKSKVEETVEALRSRWVTKDAVRKTAEELIESIKNK